MANDSITSVRGFRAAAMHCGIKTTESPDLALLASDTPATAAAVFTTNRVVGAPITVGRRHVRNGVLRGVIINSGCSNVCTGQRGVEDAEEMCVLTAASLNALADHGNPIHMADILPSSTGIIGHFLPMEKIRPAVGQLALRLSDSQETGEAFADAILTTDTRRKTASGTVTLGNKLVTIAGCCKGSGMIAPNMATMLAYVATDAAITPAALRQIMRAATATTFNSVTVDQHTSTSDTFAALANGLAENRLILTGSANAKKFQHALHEVCDALARQIAADGEGATRLVHVHVDQAASEHDAKKAAFAIANSPLVKTAIHGGDPNWGRFVSAAGYSGAKMRVEKAACCIGALAVFRDGRPTEAPLSEIEAAMRQPEVHITVSLGFKSRFNWTVYTCDLSREYITINADYHT